jgi:hypothetical protein
MLNTPDRMGMISSLLGGAYNAYADPQAAFAGVGNLGLIP